MPRASSTSLYSITKIRTPCCCDNKPNPCGSLKLVKLYIEWKWKLRETFTLSAQCLICGQLLFTYCFALEDAVQPPSVAFYNRSFKEDLWTQPDKARAMERGGSQRCLDEWMMHLHSWSSNVYLHHSKPPAHFFIQYDRHDIRIQSHESFTLASRAYISTVPLAHITQADTSLVRTISLVITALEARDFRHSQTMERLALWDHKLLYLKLQWQEYYTSVKTIIIIQCRKLKNSNNGKRPRKSLFTVQTNQTGCTLYHHFPGYCSRRI